MGTETKIDRRSFNKAALMAAIAGVACGGSVVAAAAQCPPVPWELFCDSDEYWRYNVSTPFVKDGVKYATDCQIQIWSPTDERDSKNRGRLPPASKVAINAIECDEPWLPWPDADYKPLAFPMDGDTLLEALRVTGVYVVVVPDKDGYNVIAYDRNGETIVSFMSVRFEQLRETIKLAAVAALESLPQPIKR